MSLKDLFESTKVTKSGSADETAYEVESEAYTEAFAVDKDEFVPPVDFSTASNFARYGSAAKYYEDSIQRIYNNYPYDGSKYEVLAFHNSSSYLDRWMLEYKYPKTTGYVELGTTSGSGDWLSMVSESSGVGGYALPDTSANNILEYIEIKGGPHTGSADRTFETQDVSLKKLWNFSNVYNSGSAREYNLEYDLRTGMTVEFWMLKNAFYTSKTEREVVFDLWNNENSSSSGYGRLMIELSGTGVTDESVIRLTAQSGTTGFVNEGIATITTSDVADGVWKHYAVTLKNKADNSGVNAKLYINGQVSGSATLGSAGLGRVTGSMMANIGALIAPPSGATGYYDTTTIAKGGAKLSASIDEFRFWKLERDPRQIGRNWFTQVGGGSNNDDANVGLGVYYKFNEGISNSGSRDRTILDYSGRISNGFWKGGVAASRNSGSAMASGSHNMGEHHDPIIYSEHPNVADLETAMVASGTLHDNLNNSKITAGFPDWIDSEGRGTTLKHFSQIIASYFDKLHMQIDSLQTLKERYAGSYSSGDVSASFKPVPFAKNLVSQFGIAVPELLQEAELIENFLSRNEAEEFGEKLHNIRNQIYSNIYANLLYVFKTKGTEKSMRNMLRCFGIDDELVRINTYSDYGDYTFKDNRRSTSNKTNYVSFNHSDRVEATVYQAVSMSVDGIYGNPSARAYITGSDSFGEFNTQTMECEVFFPLKTEDILSPQWYPDSFTTSSLFGAMGTVESQTDTRFPTSDPVDLRVFALKDELESTRARFMVSSSVLGTVTSDYYEDVYDDTRWNFAVRVKPSKHPWVEHISGSTGALGAQTFDVEFYGVNVFTDVKQHEFLKTTTVSEAIGKSFLSSSKRCYVGALHENFTGSILHKSNVEVGNLRYWMSDVSDEVVLTHAMDQSSHGTESPYKNVFIYQSSMSGTYVPQIATLALHWNFDNVTGSGNSPTDTENTKDAQFIVQDISSGSAEHGERYEPAFSDQVMMQHIGLGDFFLDNKTDVVNTRYIPTAKIVLPEYMHSSDMVEIRQRDDEFFTMESRPSKVIYSIEKSMYQTISEEMVKMFATIKDFDNLIGEPVNRYRAQYKDMAKLRQLFFEKMPNTPDLDKYVDYYKWIDDAVSRFIEDLFPASAMHTEGMQTMVESHMLERSKYQTKYPSMEFEGDPPEGSAEGINKLLYDYQRGSAPIPLAHDGGIVGSGRTGSAEMMDQDQNCLWWSKRADREHPILASTALSASSPGMNLSGTLTSRAGIFSASTSAFNRKLHTPYKYSIEETRLIHGGINYDSNKKLSYVYPATVPFSPRGIDYGKFGGYPLGYLLAKDMDRDASPSASLPNCDMRLSSSYGAKVKREGYKVIDGWEGFKSEAGGQAHADPVAAVGYVTISDASALNADGTGTAFELTTTDGTVVTVSQHGSNTTNTDTNTPTYQRSTVAATVATRIATCLNGHGKLTATANTNVVTITQATGGNNGNRTIILTGSWGSKPGLTAVGIQGGRDGITATPNWGSSSYHHFRGNLVMPFNVISSSQHDVNAGYTALINQDLTVFEGTGIGHSTDAGTYVNKMRQGYGQRRTDDGSDADKGNTPTKMGGLGRGVNLVNLHTDTYGDDKETPMQGPFTEKYVGGRAYRHAPINDGTDTLSTRQEGWLVLISTALSTSSGVLHASSGGVGLAGPDYPFPHGPFPFANDDAINWRPIGGRYYRDETAKRPVNIRNIQMTTQSATPTVIGAHRHDIIADDDDPIEDWTYNIYEQTAPGAAVTVIGNYTKNYEVVHTVGRSNQKPFLRDNQSVRNIEQTASFAEAPNILQSTDNNAVVSYALGAGTGTKVSDPTLLSATTHVETILTQKFQASASLGETGNPASGPPNHQLPTDPTNTVLQGARVIVAQVSGGVGGANLFNGNAVSTSSLDTHKFLPTADEHIYMDHTVQSRETGSTNLDTIFANKFSAPGGPRNQSKGFLDLAAEEYSVYNAYPWRNLEVLGSSSGEYLSTHAQILSSSRYPRLGLRSLRALPSGRFGGIVNYSSSATPSGIRADATDANSGGGKIGVDISPDTGIQESSADYTLTPSWHKVHRNGRLEARATTSHRSIGPTHAYVLSGQPGASTSFLITDPWGHTYRYITATAQAPAESLTVQDSESPVLTIGYYATSSNSTDQVAALHSLRRALRVQLSGAITTSGLVEVVTPQSDPPYLYIRWATEQVNPSMPKWSDKQADPIYSSTWENFTILTTTSEPERAPRLDYVEKRVYDNDYVTRPIPQNDYQYAWISASLAPSGSNSTLPNLGAGYHMDGFNHPTPSGSRPVDPIIFISASEMGSSHGTAGTHADAEDRPYRYWGIGSNLGGAQFIPNVHRLNLNLVDNQNTWLTDGSGAVALGHFTTGGILPADAPLPIDHGHDHKNPHGGAYASQLANIHNYVNERFQAMPAPQHAFSVMSGSSLSKADNRANIPAVSLKYLNQMGTYYHEEMLDGIEVPMRDWMFIQGPMIGRDLTPTRDVVSDPIRQGLLPQYWTGSGAGENHQDQAAPGGHSIYAMNQSVAGIFNSLMWKRNGPYGYPTWKQIRGGEHPLAQTMRDNNRYVIVDPQSDRVVYPTPGTVGPVSKLGRMVGTDAVAAFRSLGHINTAERKHNHYHVPVLDRSATTLLFALHKGEFEQTAKQSAGTILFDYSIVPEKMLYVNASHVNNLRYFPNSKLNEDLGLRDFKTDRTAYNDLREMYTEMLDTNGQDAYTLADLTYRETIFPKPENISRPGMRQRSLYAVGYWASGDSAEYMSPTSDDSLRPFYDPTGRRTMFDHPDPANQHGVWEFYRGSGAPPKKMNKAASFLPTAFFGEGATAAYVTPESIRNRVALSVSASVWSMDGHIPIENLDYDGLSGSAQYRASSSAEQFNVDPQAPFGMHATASAKTHGAPGILQNQYTWFHNGMNLGYEPEQIGDLTRTPVIMSDAMSAADYLTLSERAGVERIINTRTGDSINISERFVELPAAGMAFGPSYSRPHMLVGRDSYCSPSAGKAAYSRRFNFASTTYDNDGVNTKLSGASYYGKGDGMTPFYHGLTALNAGGCTIPFTASYAPKYLSLGDRVVSQLTRSIGHQVEGLYVSDWQWKAPLQSGKAPFYANYSEWFEELRGKSQDRQVLPEYRISDRIPYFVLDKQGRFTSKDSQWLSIHGNPSSSAGTLTSSANVTAIGTTITGSFMSDYAVTAKAGLLDAIMAENADITEPYELTLTCDAILKFLPYQGFYPQLRTVDLCKQFIDSYDEHVSFESDMGINDKPSSFVRQDSSGSSHPPTSGNWYGFSPWVPDENFGTVSGDSKATGMISFGTSYNAFDGDESITIESGDTSTYVKFAVNMNISAGTHRKATSGEVSGQNGSEDHPYVWYFRGNPAVLFGTDQGFGDAIIFGAAVDAAADASADGYADFNVSTAGQGGNLIQQNVHIGGATQQWWRITLEQDAAGTAGNTPFAVTNIDSGEILRWSFSGGATGAATLATAFFYSNPEAAGYNFEIDEIVDPTLPRVGGSGELTSTGFETHGRNAAAAKRPFYGPFMAPGILFNTIKSGIAVDYPVLNRKLATTASVDRDGGRNYQILNEYFDQRLPFETLVEPERYLTNVPLVDMEPHPSASINVTASWNGQGDPLYKMMMHNFLAEIPNFYLADENMQSFVSLPESDGNFGQVEAVVHNGNQVIPEYKMMVKVWKSQVPVSTRGRSAPSASNHWQNHRGPTLPIKDKAHDGTNSGSMVFLGQYEPCYYTDVIGMENWGTNRDGGTGVGYVMDDYQSPHGVKYKTIATGYPRPQRLGPETITMYSRPSAFGPPSAGGYAFRPEFEYIYTGSAAPMSMSYQGAADGVLNAVTNLNADASDGFGVQFVEGHVAGSGSVGKVADRVSTTWGMKDGTNGYNAPFTPPYYDGQAWAFITFKPTRTGKHYLDDIWEQSTINFLRYEFNYISGAYGDMGTVGPQGYAMNVNAMQVDAAVNLKGKTSIKEVTYDAVTGLPKSVADSNQTSARNSAWVIQTKFETPILHFGYGLTDNQTALTLSGSANAISSVESNGYNHGYAGLCEPIGMWHQYGEIPSASQGIYLEVADVPKRYLRFGTEMTIANPKWLHITGSPDPLAGCTAGVGKWIADGWKWNTDHDGFTEADGTEAVSEGTVIYGAMDWDGHLATHSESWSSTHSWFGDGFNPIIQSQIPRWQVGGSAVNRGLVGKGYRFSGSFSGSDLAYVVGRDTIDHPDQVADGTLTRGGRQQYMRWRLMSTGSLAGIIADMTHLQIISADDGTILDTTWGCPLTISPAAAPGISGSAPCFERGFYIDSSVTGSNIISGSGQGAEFTTTDNSSSVHYVHADHRNYLNRGYPGTSSARQRLMGVGKLTSSLCSDGQPIPFRNYYTQWKHDVPNNNVDKESLAAGYTSPLHKNKRGVIPAEPHFSNNISTASFGDAIGCTLYSHKYDVNNPLYNGIGRTVMLFDSGSALNDGTGVASPTGSFIAGGITAKTKYNSNNDNGHIKAGSIHAGPTVGLRGPHNGWNSNAPISNSLGIGRAEIICGYTGSSGRYIGATPRDDHEHFRIDGPLSGSNPRYPNTNFAGSNFTWGETSYERWSSAYHGQTLSANSGTTATAQSTIQRGVQGFHSDQVLPYTDGLQDIYPLGMRGYTAKNLNNQYLSRGGHQDMARMSPIIQWYSNPVHIANVRWNDMVLRGSHGMYAGSIIASHGLEDEAFEDLTCALSSPRTVPSGKFLPVGGIPALTKSLGSLVGFDSGAKKLGQLAEIKTVKEAVIVMPYVMGGPNKSRRFFVELDKPQIDRYYGRGEFSNTAYWASLEQARDLKGTATSPVSGLQVNLGQSVLRQMRLMEDYVIPPHLDFTKEHTATPYAMYVFEYEHQFSAQDLSDMWQGLFPDSGKAMRQVTKQVTHKLNVLELLGTSATSGDTVPAQIRFMVFKVKQRAEINYFAKTKNSLDDARFKFKFAAGKMKRSSDYSYNWPYDFFSLVETAKIDMSLTLRNKKLIQNVELQELNEEFALEPTPTPLFGFTLRSSIPVISISEASVRTALRMATAATAEASITATFGPIGGSRL